jgi:D-glycero-beta-D-manno-heptose 1-phosphate adenylyltransferase
VKPEQNLQTKILPRSELKKKTDQWRAEGKTIAFTNGCFDILHAGHIASLTEAAQHGDVLVVALNSDSSVKELKGENRPVNDEKARATVMAALGMVDAVTVFFEPTPRELIIAIQPDVLVKGGDYKVEDIAGAKEVLDRGGKVVINPIVDGFSTTSIIQKMKSPTALPGESNQSQRPA